MADRPLSKYTVKIWTDNLAVGNQPAIAVICGPTGSGKTAAALTLAEKYPVEVVSADSRQVIKYLDIGTAKPTAEERGAVTFHLLDIVEPGERYSAYRFLVDAEAAIGRCLQMGNIPLVVGGTGLYLNALTNGVVEIPEDHDGLVRSRLETDLGRLGPKALHARLMQVDPDEARKIHPNNAIRVMRALEIFELTGKSKSQIVISGSYKISGYRFVTYCLLPPRDELYAEIDSRVDRMMRAGLLEELRVLITRGLGESIRRANVIGYQELMEHLDGRYSIDEAIALIKQNTRRYAKRQMTWFRHQTDGRVFANTKAVAAAVAADLEITKDGQRA
jgi:tRNA dimethylallyltransferase